MSKFFYNRATTRICAKKPFIVIECNCDCFGFGKFPINNCVLYSPGWTNLRTTIKTEILPLNVVNDQLVTFVPSECLSAKIAAADLPTNLRNVQLASFFRLYFCCLLDQDLKGQCRWKNWAILRWFLAHVILLACVNKDFVYSGSIGLI